MNEEQYEIAKKLYLQNKSLREIEEVLNINRKKLSLRLKADGIRVRGSLISEDIVLKALDMLKTEKSTSKVAKQLGVDRQVLTRLLREKEFDTPKMKAKRCTRYNYESDTSLAIVADHKTMSLKDLSIKYDISTSAILNILHYHHLDTSVKRTTHTCNSNVFDIIDTEHKAYWLGFLYADGSIANDERYVVELGLKYTDKHHIEKFIKFINGTQQIKDRIVKLKGKEFNSSRVQVFDKHMVKSLVSHGCTARKSLTLTFPDLQSNLVHHFMRGYFDGDGSICISQGQLRFNVLGTKDFLDSYVHHLGLHKNKYVSNGNAYGTGYSGNRRVKAIYDYLYKDATIYLERKQAVFSAVLG